MWQIKTGIVIFQILLHTIASSQVPDGMQKAGDVARIKKLIRQSAEATQSIRSEFIQEKNLTMMEEIIVSKGRFLFKKENKVKWEYVEPINYTILVSGSRFIINNDGKVQEYDTESNKLFREINSMIVMAIQGDFVDNENFNALFFEDNNSFLARLTPLSPFVKDVLQTIEIRFQKSDMAVNEIKFIEPGEDYTLIVFKNREANISIPDSLFTVP